MLFTTHQLVDNYMEPKEKSFFKKYKKEILIILGAILAFALLFYFLFLNKETPAGEKKVNLPNNAGFNFKNLFGFLNNDNETVPEGEGEENYFQIGEPEGLIKVWDRPVAGYGFYYKEYTFKYLDENNIEQTATDTKTMLQFVDSETGYIYEKDLLAPTSTPYQVTNNSYPNIVKAYFLNDKSGYKSKVFLQYADGEGIIKTISATVPTFYGTTANLMNILSLSDNIKNFNISPNNKIAGFVVEKSKKTGGRDDFYTDWYIIDNPTDSYGRRVYNSELSFWKLFLTDKGEVYAYTTETAYEPNSLYKLELNKTTLGKLSQIYSGRNGMSFLVNGNNLVTSIFTGSGLKIYKSNNFSGDSIKDEELNSLNFTTLTNKCVQETFYSDNLIICGVPKEIINYPSGLPDAWYQGMTTWEDSLYLVNRDYPNGHLLLDFKLDANVSDIIDARNLDTNDQIETHLAFINKNDGSLWTLNILNILDPYGGD